MQSQENYSGTCFCGAVEVTVTGAPAAMGYCHCDSCRSWSAAPVNAFTLWKPGAVRVTRGADNLGDVQQDGEELPQVVQVVRRPRLHRASGLGLVDVYAAVIREFPFKAGRARQLPGDRAPDEGRRAQVQGHAEGDGRLGRHAAGMSFRALLTARRRQAAGGEPTRA